MLDAFDGPDGFMEAYDIEAVGRERGAWHPLTPSGVPLLAVLFGVHVLPETYSFGFFWVGYASVLCALLGSTADAVHVSGFGGFWLLFHTFLCEGGPRILRSILGETHGFSLSPRIRQSLVQCLCRVRCTGNSVFTGR